jgi:hypothetical protein
VVTVRLNGVAANNVFWVADRGMAITDEPHELVGNFIGGGFLTLGNPPTIKAKGVLTQPRLKGVRFLGFLVFEAPDFGTATAMTTTDEPLLVPVLQLHSPSGTPSANLGTAFGSDKLNNEWLQHATTPTTFNAVLIMGDSPSRPIPGSESEYGGGLPNFPRFLEAWEQSETDAGTAVNPLAARIRGGFIQFFRSKYASAPFEAISDRTKDTSLFFDAPAGGEPDYMKISSDNGFVYRGGASFRKAPFYRPPTRQWGYDVGLLFQTPDLFSRRFATPSAGTPNEYYREVGRDDKWVQALLCAAEPKAGGQFDYSLGEDNPDLPPNCPQKGEYN